MNIGLHVENVYFVVTSINPFVPTVAFSQLSFPHYAERRSLSDSKCWNLVAKTQRWVKMG